MACQRDREAAITLQEAVLDTNRELAARAEAVERQLAEV